MSRIGDYLETQLGRITMYRLMLYALSAISSMALLLMSVGYLPYSPLAFIVSLLLFMGVSFGANQLFGRLFGVKPHGESAFITAMILALLFVPPATFIEGIQLGLVAVIAMASKYVLVYRGRHVVNPAAIAIVIAGISGLAYAAWWIATPALLPVTALAAFLVLFKTKRLQMAGVFLLVAFSVIVLRMSMTDDVSLQTIVMGLTSWPLLFFAGMMLSEPLTLPPRRRQQLIEAGVVGVLFGSALHIGIVTMNPALALVVGNLLAWYWSTRGAIKLRFVAKTQMSPTLYDFTFDSNKPSFVPGQYLELTLPHRRPDSRGQRRIFSIVGRPGAEHLSIGTRITEKPSSFKRALLALRSGQTVYATRIAGDFVLPNDPSVPVVLIAGGIGVTPYISYIMASERRLKLMYVVSSNQDMAYIETLRHHEVTVTVVSPDDTDLPDSDWSHRKAKGLTSELLIELIGDDPRTLVYISGPPGMVDATKHMATGLGFKVKTDHFSGY